MEGADREQGRQSRLPRHGRPDGSIVKTLARLGFDGVYLDWVEAYDDEQVAKAAAAERVDAAAIDALAAEDTWFHGEGDAEWDDPRAGDLHERHEGEWSTASRLRQYRKYVERGLPVFTVDYCVDRKNAADVYRLARKEGLRPLVTRVSLSRLTTTPP